MSHYTVMVVGTDIAEQLQPYTERVQDLSREVLEFKDIEEKHRIEYLTTSATFYKVTNPETNQIDWAVRSDGRVNDSTKHETKQILLREKYGTFEDFMRDFCGYEERDPVKNRYGYWQNPKGKWDWWTIGGRWSNLLLLKPGRAEYPISEDLRTRPGKIKSGWTDSAKKGDIDFNGMRWIAANRGRGLYRRFHHLTASKDLSGLIEIMKKVKSGEERDNRKIGDHEVMKVLQGERDWSFFYRVEEFINGEQWYADLSARRATCLFAFLRNGIWRERGQVAYFGVFQPSKVCSTSEEEERAWLDEFDMLLNAVPDDEVITVVDCHT